MLELGNLKNEGSKGRTWWRNKWLGSATSIGTSWSLGPGPSSRTHGIKQLAYQYDCANWSQETPDKPCLRIQPAAMERNRRSLCLSQSLDLRINYSCPAKHTNGREYWEIRRRWKCSWCNRSHFSFLWNLANPFWPSCHKYSWKMHLVPEVEPKLNL